jgi:hypothetical protein
MRCYPHAGFTQHSVVGVAVMGVAGIAVGVAALAVRKNRMSTGYSAVNDVRTPCTPSPVPQSSPSPTVRLNCLPAVAPPHMSSANGFQQSDVPSQSINSQSPHSTCTDHRCHTDPRCHRAHPSRRGLDSFLFSDVSQTHSTYSLDLAK